MVGLDRKNVIGGESPEGGNIHKTNPSAKSMQHILHEFKKEERKIEKKKPPTTLLLPVDSAKALNY